MGLRFYSNMVSQASRSLAMGMFVTALMLIGFGVLILAMPAVFAMLAAGVFFLVGFGCAWTALKIYIAQARMNRMMRRHDDDGRENVRIHRGDDLGF